MHMSVYLAHNSLAPGIHTDIKRSVLKSGSQSEKRSFTYICFKDTVTV